VGKAKNLHKRVNSYFNRELETVKLRVMVSRIVKVEYVIVANEADAFLLENTLIKKHLPRYNVNLRDDKTYPSICVTKEPFPRVFSVRQRKDENARYFGPYTSGYAVYNLIMLVHKLYKLRTCKKLLTPEFIAKKKRPCLERDINNCLAPCIGGQTEEDYKNNIEHVVLLLKGRHQRVEEELYKQMMEASERYDFEHAMALKQNLDLIRNFYSKSLVVNTSVGTIDVFFLKKEGEQFYCNFTRIETGSLIYSHTFEVSSPIEDEMEVVLATVIFQVKEIVEEIAPIALVQYVPRGTFEGIDFVVPKMGDRLKILQLAEENCNVYILHKKKQYEKTNPETTIENRLKEMQTDLCLKNLPEHIECFDNSNTQGTNPVASCVVFKRTKPSKRDYRHFNIKTVEGPDDFASMKEIIMRRYSRMIAENVPLPQLIVVDGGKGQLSAAYEILQELGIDDKVEIIGLAKRLEEVFVVNNPIPLYLSKKGFTLKVLMQLRDEAHRFAITFHRDKRSKSMVNYSLLNIQGLGNRSVDALLKKYKTIDSIKRAGYEDVKANISQKVANVLRAADFFI
jgi:excinuclease ABC subunit C